MSGLGAAARRVRLVLHHLGDFQYTDPGLPGRPAPAAPDFRTLPVGQVRVRLRVVSASLVEQAIFTAAVSTAQPLSVFPEWCWRLFPSGIQWLPPQPRLPVPNLQRFPDRHPFRLGRVQVIAYDQDRTELAERSSGRHLAPFWVTARFLHGDPIPDPVFGLHAGAINPHRLAHDPLSQCHPLVPAEDVLHQQWWLQDD